MKDIDLDSLNINKYVNKELLKDFINRWGNAQICDSCGWVSPFGLYSHRIKCCGKEMRLALKQDKENKQMKEIKNCPFCGGKGNLQDSGEVWGTVWVSCEQCGAEGAYVEIFNGVTEDDAIDKWNMRV